MKRENILQNHWTNFNQTWNKTFLGEGVLILLKRRATLFSKGRLKRKYINAIKRLFSEPLNQFPPFDKASLGKGNVKMFIFFQ